MAETEDFEDGLVQGVRSHRGQERGTESGDGLSGFQAKKEKSSGSWREVDRARQIASWEGKLEPGSTEVGRQAFWEVDIWDWTRRRASGKDNSVAVPGGRGGQDSHRKDKQRP